MTVEGNQAIAVSRGLGTHTINLRFLNYAEVVHEAFFRFPGGCPECGCNRIHGSEIRAFYGSL